MFKNLIQVKIIIEQVIEFCIQECDLYCSNRLSLVPVIEKVCHNTAHLYGHISVHCTPDVYWDILVCITLLFFVPSTRYCKLPHTQQINRFTYQ